MLDPPSGTVKPNSGRFLGAVEWNKALRVALGRARLFLVG